MKKDKGSLAVFGCGGHARSVADVILDSGYVIEFFFDEMSQNEERIFDIPCVKSKNKIQLVEFWHVGLGDATKRRDAVEMLTSNGRSITSVISRHAYLGKGVLLGKGVFIAHSAHVGVLASIGELTIINTCAVIEHEVIIGKYCHISVNAVVSGRVSIGNNVFVGAGAVVRDGITICDNVIIGAGAVVVKDISHPGTYIGIPCVKIPPPK